MSNLVLGAPSFSPYLSLELLSSLLAVVVIDVLGADKSSFG
jgi:hypothetical protein